MSSIVDDLLNEKRKNMSKAITIKKKIDYKFDEDEYLIELKKHIDATYDSHYSKEQFQATEFIVDGGHGTGFCIGNIMKYAQRYGKKGNSTQARKDLMKILHYAIIQLRVHDLDDALTQCADVDSDRMVYDLGEVSPK